jgi:septal ring factor EnvC (AmiA/AmiB activator)
MPDQTDAPTTRADLDRLAEAIIGNISDLRQEMNTRFDLVDQRFDSIERRMERIEYQTIGMSKSLTDAERLDSATAAALSAQQRAIDQLAQRIAHLERQANPGHQQ